MTDCSTCGHPTAPSPTGRRWCAVYGTHPALIVLTDAHTDLLVAADRENYPTAGPGGRLHLIKSA